MLSLALAALGCASAAPLETRTGAEAKRKPDGVLVEPSPAIPVAVEHARASGVVSLKPPLSIEDVRAVTKQLMHGFENEQIELIQPLLLSDAIDLFAHWGREQIIQKLRERFQRLDYTKMRGLEVAHLERAELREYEDLPAAGPHGRPPEMMPGDVVVRIPMTAPLVGGERLFEDVLVLMLRRDAHGQLKIAGIGETS